MKGYRTIALNTVAAVLGALMSTDWGAVADPKTAGLVVGGLGLANTVLRFFTDGPVGGARTGA
ncbi:hypothetical protein EYW49_02125 [Siculibacillus lacustris]|uniref:Holin n=1 Tax=Siculibacillus lacustris TaxID=1549641 RepID=A0A4V6MZ57_9HYPH|nr:hypothetical protein [Siculibacillus lacustris]TBW40976.1 hypothetical protein EYW49_02125 [Siculibacillus lacustris]